MSKRWLTNRCRRQPNKSLSSWRSFRKTPNGKSIQTSPVRCTKWRLKGILPPKGYVWWTFHLRRSYSSYPKLAFLKSWTRHALKTDCCIGTKTSKSFTWSTAPRGPSPTETSFLSLIRFSRATIRFISEAGLATTLVLLRTKW